MQIKELIKADFRNILRDPTLLAAALAPFLILAVVTAGIPWITAFVLNRWGLDITPHHRIIQIFFTLIIALVYGIISAFIILEERDESILSYIRITPFSMKGYLFYRVGFAYISTMGAVLLLTTALLITGAYSLFDSLYLLLVVPLESVLLTLTVVSFARDKVEGLAISKMTGVIPFAAVGMFYLKSVWQYPLLLLPPAWITATVEADSPGAALLFLTGSVLIHLGYAALLLKQFRRRVF